MRNITRYWMLLLQAACLLALSIPPASTQSVKLSPGILIQKSGSISPKLYRLSPVNGAAVRVSGNGITLDFHGALLDGGRRLEDGVVIEGQDIVVKNLQATGYRWGVVLQNCKNVTLVNCNCSWNANLKPGTVIDESGAGPEDHHGGGIVVRDSYNCRFRKCTCQHEWDGIDLVRSSHCVFENGDCSYCGNWGIHFWNASSNTFRNNRAVWCTTGGGDLYQALTGWQTYDAQAVGIDHNSCDNTIEHNDLRFGGDGIFIRANEGPITPGTVVPVKNGSHRNRLLYNDCSFSPNNAIEVDLVDDTEIVGNNCSYSNYGLWLGYSRRCKVTGNLCIADSTHCVEIENGQDDTFIENWFVAPETSGADYQLVLLRQNGRDKTPSGPYGFAGNVFDGAKYGVVLVGTRAELRDTRVFLRDDIRSADFVPIRADASSVAAVSGTRFVTGASRNLSALPRIIQPGTSLVLRLASVISSGILPTVSLDGIPLQREQAGQGELRISIPSDNWLSPTPASQLLKIQTAEGAVQYARVQRAGNSGPRITDVTPVRGRIGSQIVIQGSGLTGGQILLNGKQAQTESLTDTEIVLRPLTGILITSNYNLRWQKGEGRTAVTSEPIQVTVAVPHDQMPHLISAAFSPHKLHVGDLLKVTMTVRNNLPIEARLTEDPAPGFIYDETQAYYEMGKSDTPNYLHLRVSTDFFVGGHHPGSWPWMFGFSKSVLMPGETATVVGYVRLRTPGIHKFRIGLVCGGSRFIDDNAYQTEIEVLP
jgi:parallel beta-helix repeat protein